MTHVAAMAHVVAVTDACEVIGAANVHVAAVGHPDIVQAVVDHAAIGFWKQDACSVGSTGKLSFCVFCFIS